MLNRFIKFFFDNKLLTILLIAVLVIWGIVCSPFSWKIAGISADPVPVDAIPDIGENQQIVFTEWKGQSPQNIEDQITYPLTSYLLGIPGVKTIRSNSMFGFSSIYVIFKDGVDFYWSRTRILEKINSIPPSLLPAGVKPALGPDATALGEVFWYGIEPRDSLGRPCGGWSPEEIRKVQDYYVKYALNSAEGVSEVASIGSYAQEYQVNVDPEALKAYDIPLVAVAKAIKDCSSDTGAKTIEINNVEYIIRGLAYVKSISDIEKAVVTIKNNKPIYIRDIAKVQMGPQSARAALDKDGSDLVGGVVIARYGANPLQVIKNIKEKIKEISPGLPYKILKNGEKSKLTIVPFYDRSVLIHETLATLKDAIFLQILIVILVVIVMLYNLRASLLISCLLPIAVLMSFIAMKYFKVDANIVALSGIAIAIGTMVDLGIILSENVLKHIKERGENLSIKDAIYNASAEVSSAIVTAVATTVVSFIPVFTMQEAEGKLFRPLAFTKTFAIIAAVIVSLFILPLLAQYFMGWQLPRISQATKDKYNIFKKINLRKYPAIDKFLSGRIVSKFLKHWQIIVLFFVVLFVLSKYWLPLGPAKGLFINSLFVFFLIFLILGFFAILEYFYKQILTFCLEHKKLFLSIPIILCLFASLTWLGFNKFFGFIPNISVSKDKSLKESALWKGGTKFFPGIAKEFMPSLDEGSFLLMPSSMPNSSFEFNRKSLALMDRRISSIPEVEECIGKMGRVESALDPAPISMYENLINYKPEYYRDENFEMPKFKVDKKNRFITVDGDSLSNDECLKRFIGVDKLIKSSDGNYFRNWRSNIKSTDDIWKEIVNAAKLPGISSAPKLQPIQTRLIMLQSGMRSPTGIKVFGPDLETIQKFSLQLEKILKHCDAINPSTVFAERTVAKPYLEINIDRDKLALYGLTVNDVQQTIQMAISGKVLSYTIDGRERYPIRIRYARELRDNPQAISQILQSLPNGASVPLSELVKIKFVRGPQSIKSEDNFLLSYVIFAPNKNYSEVSAVNAAQKLIEQKIKSGELQVPKAVSYKFAGTYENQQRAQKRLALIIPIVLLIIFLILYFQFRSVSTALMVFSGIAMAFTGAFILMWLYSQGWFMNFSVFGLNMRELFHLHTINLSVAVWVGFIALFGIATDDGVLIATYLDQSFAKSSPKTIKDLRAAILAGGLRRIKPAVMTSATTIIALLPVLMSNGRGSDIMIPMAIPAFGGMLFAAITFFIVPVLYSIREERRIRKNLKSQVDEN